MLDCQHEEVRGPVWGHYLACYAIRDGEHFRAFAKICAERPHSVWEAQATLAKIAGGLHEHPQAAIDDAVDRASRRLRRTDPGWLRRKALEAQTRREWG